jgi:hypothetical protein
LFRERSCGYFFSRPPLEGVSARVTPSSRLPRFWIFSVNRLLKLGTIAVSTSPSRARAKARSGDADPRASTDEKSLALIPRRFEKQRLSLQTSVRIGPEKRIPETNPQPPTRIHCHHPCSTLDACVCFAKVATSGVNVKRTGSRKEANLPPVQKARSKHDTPVDGLFVTPAVSR